MASGIVWQTPPSALGAGLRRYGDRAHQAVLTVAKLVADEAEARAKAEAPWTDRTGNARQSLRGEAVALGRETVAIYLSGGMDYSKWLELAHGEKYRIILPTLESLYPVVLARLKAVLG